MTNLLSNLSDALATTVAEAGPHLVRVEARRRLPASGIVWSSEGVIVTARHVVRHRNKIRVGLPDGSVVSATLAGHDSSTDIAVLKVEAGDLSAPAWSDDLAVGHFVLALGRPGRTVQATLGIVSALGDAWRTPGGGEIDRYLQTDVVMYPGFSGGPLVGAGGAFLGLNSSALMRGVSITVPAATIGRVVNSVLTHGRVRRGYLGVSTQPVKLPRNLTEAVGQETGMLIVGVEPDSPADQGGLLLGDTITSFDGQRIHNHDDLLALLGGERVGQKLPVGIVRGGEVRSVNVSIGERE